MGKAISSLVIRPFRNFNVENRAEKAISLDKRQNAPRHPSTLDSNSIQNSNREDFLQKQMTRPDELLERLKTVRVNRTEERAEGSPVSKTLLQERQRKDFAKPKQPAKGKVTFSEAIAFLTNHSTKPDEWTAASIAAHHGLKVQIVEQVLSNFRVMSVQINTTPNKKEDKMKGSLYKEFQKSLTEPAVIKNEKFQEELKKSFKDPSKKLEIVQKTLSKIGFKESKEKETGVTSPTDSKRH